MALARPRVPNLVRAPAQSASTRTLAQYAGDQTRALTGVLTGMVDRLNAVLPKDGSEPMAGPLELVQYLVATRPAASAANAWTLIAVTDAGAGLEIQYSDGSTWTSL